MVEYAESQPVNVCVDPDCQWAGLPDQQHFSRHNRPCGHLFIGRDGRQHVCVLAEGHEPATVHRGDQLD